MMLLHVFPYSFRVSGGHSNAILAFMWAQSLSGIDVRAISPPESGTNHVDRRAFVSLEIIEIPVVEYESFLSEFLAERDDVIVVFYDAKSATKRCAKRVRESGNRYLISSGGYLHYRGLRHFIKKFIYLNVVSFAFTNQSSAFHFITEREYRRAKRLFPFTRAPFLLVPNVVDVEGSGECNRLAAKSSQTFVFNYLGRIDPQHKGLDLAMKAFAKVVRKRNCRLRLAGGDWKGGTKTLKELATELGCSDSVEILEPQYDEDKWQFIQSGDLFLALSRWEAFGIAIVEAMAAGIPVLASDQLNLADDMRKADVAMITKLSVNDLARKMEDAMDNPAALQAMASRGREWAGKYFSLAAVGNQFRLELKKMR